MRKIAVVTTGRSDYGLYLPILQKIVKHPALKLLLYVTGMHLRPEFGNTVLEIEKDGFKIADKIPMLSKGDSPQEIAESMGRGTVGFSKIFQKNRPDILLVLGDRFEMHAAAIAAIPFNISIAHIHGGEVTQGSVDEYFRHSLTKISHLHFVATREYAGRIKQMGEEPWRITVSGAPGLDNILNMPRYSKEELERKFKVSFAKQVLLVTFHPVTTEYEKTEAYISNLLNTLKKYAGYNIVFTAPNSDTNNKIIAKKMKLFVKSYDNAFLVENFGQKGYISMMGYAAAMAGNSSSGIIEASSFKLPVVNIGNRQNGRIKPKNVIDTGYAAQEINAGIQKALSGEFRHSLRDTANPYGDGKASERIVSVLEKADLKKLTPKKFHDIKTG